MVVVSLSHPWTQAWRPWFVLRAPVAGLGPGWWARASSLAVGSPSTGLSARSCASSASVQ